LITTAIDGEAGSRTVSMPDVRMWLGPHWLGGVIDVWDDPWFRFARLLREIDSSIAVQRGAKWLDLGCHQGQFASLVSAKYGVSATGVDGWPAVEAVQGWQYRQADLERGVELGDDFTYLSALEVLEHMTDTDRFLDECRNQLVPGGYLILTTPNINSLRNRIEVPLGLYPNGLEYRNVIHHVRLYNVDKLRLHVTEHGFDVCWIRGVNFAPMRVIRRAGTATWDRPVANALPQLCGNFMLLARKR
jgi:2-polyprenyl-3-methyl-5-hydroxy-6-metoxy-1,4-benzoquinol methylase